MLKKTLALLLILLAIYSSFNALLPSTKAKSIATNFSTENALHHLKNISQEPHFLGNSAHTKVRDYLINELQKLGLKTQIQEGYSLSKWGNLAKAKNIITKIKGSKNGKALLLLSHYDSNPHSSYGASDAGSGVVTILEGVRAFLSENKTPKNDIIIVFTDGEELGLNGADIFVNQHPWAKNIGLVLNFEARGSGGPSYMLMETNQGNANLIKAFKNANPKYPVANSLAYSIYKMLPNDTDLTRFREDGDIDGFNFAFIDDHYDYHTALDTHNRLDNNTLLHQSSYLMPLLQYFSNADLNNLKSNKDYVYFNVPYFKLISYPFSWVLPMLIIAFLIFLLLIIYGYKKNILYSKAIALGFLAFLSSILISGLLGYLGWKVLLAFYPQYNEILHGFTYNGHTYIATFVLFAIAICMFIYHKIHVKYNTASLQVAPILVWMLICTVFALYLKGGSFFIIPLYFGLLSLYLLIKTNKKNIVLHALIAVPILWIITPLIQMFPVGLGLKIIFVSSILVVLLFGMILAVFNNFKKKKRWGYLFLCFGILGLITAHKQAKFTVNSPKPNSLLYILNTNTNEAIWATYDQTLDTWTKNFLTSQPDVAQNKNTIGSKYKTGFTYTKKAAVKPIKKPNIEIKTDTVFGKKRTITLEITSLRNANRFEVFADSSVVFNSFKINGVYAKTHSLTNTCFNQRLNNRLFSYYVTDNEPLFIECSFPASQKTTLQVYEATYNLLNNSLFTVPQRLKNQIPKPFVLNDAVVTKTAVSF